MGYEDAKKGMNQALESDKTKAAVDIAVTGALAVQPNGPAKVPAYNCLKHTNTLLQTTQEDGIENGIQETSKDVAKSQIASQAAGGVVDSSQQAVTMAAENDTVSKGIEEANKNFNTPSEQAAKDTLGAVFSNGADAMMSEGSSDDE
ncbi:hypothetical protein [Halovenus marina]|uniref:hypothetical protein n=1 Tax=Halovenus marina TaxID=3396621 RepID=UPI003F573263